MRRGYRWNKLAVLSARLSRKAGNGDKTVKKLYVGNLPFTATEDEITQLFGEFGTVHSVALINDRETGRPRGFGFIEVDDDAMQGMISALDGKEMGGRALRVNEAQDRPRRTGGGGGGGGYGGGRGGGGDRW
ncbi:RNA-binding protein [bacterium CG17_big_fil_post_rev_8_21_14_2_50_64_8]|nr:MAG: RNA-binding protein [bacterium CG17_big_fil_post_rev_8_21_14_2_50_64_8]PJA74269.1 MAG: RNA-binding protein [bacterium CG_4_9_14_3_um_filter_65_15]